MINFANPHLLYLLLIIPVIALLYVWARVSRKLKLKKFGRLDVIERLMPDASRYMPGIKIIIELTAAAFIILAIARPYVEKTDFSGGDEETASGIEVMICFDVSNSMLASSNDDPSGISRLQRSKFILEKLVDKMHNDKVGLIVFAGDAYTQLPITSDYISAKMFINNLNTDMVPTQGTAIGSAIDMAINSFTPDSEFQKAIVLITDGENFEDNAVEAAKAAADAGIQVDVIGMGTPGEGMPIPAVGSPTGFLIYDGEEVRTALDDAGAAEIAKAGKGIYLSGNSSSVVQDLETQLGKIKQTEYKKTAIPSDSTDLFPIAICIALLLLLIDVTLPYSKIKWLKKIEFFTKK